MSSTKLNSYKTDIAAAIDEAREAIEDALECIRNQEDGPLTMRAALAEIGEKLDRVESEVCCMSYSYENLSVTIARLNQQRDEALRQRTAALRHVKVLQREQR
jgi:hypothetical protein